MIKIRLRYEYKYLIDTYTSTILKKRIESIMAKDSNSGEDGYIVNNLYLDDRHDSFYYSKYNGGLHRNKYRLRYYNNNLSFIRLERKHKDGILSYKETVSVTDEQYEMIRARKFDFILNEEAQLWQKLGVIYRLRGLHPTVEYSYKREAFVYPPGDVRITFDSPLFKSNNSALRETSYYDPLARSYGKPAYYPLLLEVKYSSFLPGVIKLMLDGLTLAHTEMSKYCIARERGFLPYGKI